MPRKKWAAPLIGVIAAACGDAVGIRTANDVTVSPQTVGIAAVGGVQVTRVRVVVGAVKLETAGVDGTVDFLSEQSFVVEAALSGGQATVPVTLGAPAGTYKEVEVSIDKLEPGKESEAAALLAHPGLAEASIAIRVSVLENGVPNVFTFTAALDRDMEIKHDPFLVIPAGGSAVTVITLDTTGWFLDALGTLLDPRDPANRSVIEANIQASFAAAVAP